MRRRRLVGPVGSSTGLAGRLDARAGSATPGVTPTVDGWTPAPATERPPRCWFGWLAAHPDTERSR